MYRISKVVKQPTYDKSTGEEDGYVYKITIIDDVTHTHTHTHTRFNIKETSGA